MLIFNNNKPIKQKRWINTKVEFIWDGTQYVEQSAEGYWYDGEMALCYDDDGPLRLTSTGTDGCLELVGHQDGYYNLLDMKNDKGTNVAYFSADGAGDIALVMRNEDQDQDIILRTDPSEASGRAMIDIKIVDDVPAIRVRSKTPSSATTGAKVRLYTDDTAAMDSGHRLGVLEFAGAEDDNNTINNGARIEALTAEAWSDGNNDADLLFYTTSGDASESEQMRILANGNVGIGATSPGHKLEIAGTFYSAGSSIDYKKHVTDLDVDSSLIHSLRPVSYNYKKEYKDFGYNVKEGKQIGLVSEEVAETIPELAIMKDGKPKNVDYQKLAVVLLAEVQSLKKDIEELKKDN